MTIPFALFLLGIGCSMPPYGPGDQHVTDSTSSTANRAVDTQKDRHAHAWYTVPDEPSTLVFDNGDTLRTGLPEVELIAEFPNPLGRKWFIFSGLKSTSNKYETSLFVLSPGDSSAAQAIQQPWHMPGRLNDAKGKECYYEAEVFAGEVLRDTIGVIWYERSLMPDGTWRLNTTILDLTGPRPDTLILFGHGRKSATIDLAFRGKCQLLDSLDQHLDP
jgi:hypothetical protein